MISSLTHLIWVHPLFKWIFCIQKGEILSNYKGSVRYKFIVLFSIFAMIVVACGGDAVEEETVVEEEVAEEAAPATTAAEVEEVSNAPEGVFKMGIYSDSQGFNIWDAVDVQQDYWTFATLSPQATSLFGTVFESTASLHVIAWILSSIKIRIVVPSTSEHLSKSSSLLGLQKTSLSAS